MTFKKQGFVHLTRSHSIIEGKELERFVKTTIF
jgi:hypothetical protein